MDAQTREASGFEILREQQRRLSVARRAIIEAAKDALLRDGRLDVDELRALLLCEQREAEALAKAQAANPIH